MVLPCRIFLIVGFNPVNRHAAGTNSCNKQTINNETACGNPEQHRLTIYMLPVHVTSTVFIIILGYLNGASILYHVTNICSFWSFRGSHWLRTRHLETAHLAQEHGVTDAGRNAAA